MERCCVFAYLIEGGEDVFLALGFVCDTRRPDTARSLAAYLCSPYFGDLLVIMFDGTEQGLAIDKRTWISGLFEATHTESKGLGLVEVGSLTMSWQY